jgi:hypothetical protein
MKTERMIPPLRDLPPGRLVARRNHLLAETMREPETFASRLSRWTTTPSSRMRDSSVFGTRLKVALTIGLAVAISIVTAALTLRGTATPSGAAEQNHSSISATSVTDVVNQVQSAFGGGVIQSASVNGSTVTVQTNAPDQSAQAFAGFEAAVLGYAVADWQAAHGETPVTDLRSLANGQSLSGMAFDVLGSDSSASPLSGDTCESAAQNVPPTDGIVSGRTLPFAGGTCVFKVNSTSADAVAAYDDVAAALAKVLPNGATPNDYPWLVEVDDTSGSPLLVSTWVPGLEGGTGMGTAYIKPGLPGASTITGGL